MTPRRNRLDLNLPVEISIRQAMGNVDSLPADVRLTEAIDLLEKAKNLVSDYIDEQLKEVKI